MDSSKAKVFNTTKDDLAQIFGFFESSIRYQEEKGYPVWRNYDRNAVTKDVENKHQYKIVMNGHIAIVFSVCYSDKIIWRHLDLGRSLYLHRIVVNPIFKGRKLFAKILEWCIRYCREEQLKNIRMDTWAANLNIIAYYKGFGFQVIENYTTPDSPDLPVHNRKLELTLLEYNFDSSVNRL